MAGTDTGERWMKERQDEWQLKRQRKRGGRNTDKEKCVERQQMRPEKIQSAKWGQCYKADRWPAAVWESHLSVCVLGWTWPRGQWQPGQQRELPPCTICVHATCICVRAGFISRLIRWTALSYCLRHKQSCEDQVNGPGTCFINTGREHN